ncbi:MAG: YdiU family protein [Betaproteobacteria bacterium]|nr:YdiU family protein [Betaproteobacteria bacterium]
MANLRFDNRFIRELPGDPLDLPRPRQVRDACWSRVLPTPVAAPRLIAHSREVATILGISEDEIASPAFAKIFAGNSLHPDMQPYAACYGGHQFGNWAGQLGDGRAITLGETVNAANERWELQLKGAGLTPYSRTADGRAVLRSSIREFLCSEAMHHLGVPTTRALCLVGTGEAVLRDMFYDGNPADEPGAVVCRVAPSFIRFGNFEILASRQDDALLEKLVDFTIARDYPHLGGDTMERRRRFFEQVCERTAIMIAHWMRVGFVHGVMNTDNMSILGLTIDYGPYGWVDNFDPDWTPNTTDSGHRRYRFGHQPQIAQWNLSRLASALLGIFPSPEPLEAALERYAEVYTSTQQEMTAAKFGFKTWRAEDDDLVAVILGLLRDAEMDMTIFFRALARLPAARPSVDGLDECFYREDLRGRHEAALDHWLARYAARVREDWEHENREPDAARRARMNAVNPKYVLRNYLAQEVIDAAHQGDDAPIHELLDVMRRPYAEQPGRVRYAKKRPDWARKKAGCSMLSCSS